MDHVGEDNPQCVCCKQLQLHCACMHCEDCGFFRPPHSVCQQCGYCQSCEFNDFVGCCTCAHNERRVLLLAGDSIPKSSSGPSITTGGCSVQPTRSVTKRIDWGRCNYCLLLGGNLACFVFPILWMFVHK